MRSQPLMRWARRRRRSSIMGRGNSSRGETRSIALLGSRTMPPATRPRLLILTETSRAWGNRNERGYVAVSRLISLTDPRGFTTQFQYDALNRVIQIADALNSVTVFAYDPNGNLLSVADAKNQTTTYTYNNMDRLATRKDALNRQESYTYDPNGNLTTFTDRKHQ